MAKDTVTRRNFMAASGVALGAGLISQQALGANDRIRIGLIGTGNRCGSHIKSLANLHKAHNIEVAAVCDVWRKNREGSAQAVKKLMGNDPFQTSRFGEVLERKDIDAVVIATPDFSHTPIMIEALKANKDVYVEKPMSLSVQGANIAVDLARKNKRVVQVGTQKRSEGRWKAAHDFIAAGKLGSVNRISAGNFFNHARWARDYADCKEADVDWEAYLFNRPMVPFDPKLLRRWHLYRMCTNGIAGLWMVHLIDAAHMVMGATYPRSAVALGGTYRWKDGRQHSDEFHALLDYPENFLFNWGMGLTNASGTHYTVHGSLGTLDLEKNTYSAAGGDEGTKIGEGKLEGPADQDHMANWLDCMRSRKTPNADIIHGHQHSVASIMAAKALHSGQRMRYDRKKRDIVPG